MGVVKDIKKIAPKAIKIIDTFFIKLFTGLSELIKQRTEGKVQNESKQSHTDCFSSHNIPFYSVQI